jgi:hypothetical protein
MYFYRISGFIFLKKNGHKMWVLSWWHHQASKDKNRARMAALQLSSSARRHAFACGRASQKVECSAAAQVPQTWSWCRWPRHGTVIGHADFYGESTGRTESTTRSGDHSKLTKLTINNGERRTTTYSLMGWRRLPWRGNRQRIANVGGATQQRIRATTTLLGLVAARQARCERGCFN